MHVCNIKTNMSAVILGILVLTALIVFWMSLRGNDTTRDCRMQRHKCRVPPILVQTHQSTERIRSNKDLAAAQDEWKGVCKQLGWQYTFYDDEACEAFVHSEFPSLLSAYQNFPLPVMRADLFRYLILYRYGGIYADADTRPIGTPEELDDVLRLGLCPDEEMAMARENREHLCQWIFSAVPGATGLREVIEHVRERAGPDATNVDMRGNEHEVHRVTGPGVFTDALQTDENMARIRMIPEARMHRGLVHHMFSGTWNDGWCQRRDKLVHK